MTAPIFRPLELEVDWQVLPKGLMFSVLDLPRELDAIHSALQSPHLEDPPYDDDFYERRRLFAQFAVKVEHLVRELRSLLDVSAQTLQSKPGLLPEATASRRPKTLPTASCANHPEPCTSALRPRGWLNAAVA